MSSVLEKPKMFYWSDQRIKWYDDAVKLSNYHNMVIDEISPYIDKTNTVFDVACGLGYISERISPLVKNVYSFDYDKNAINSLNSRCKNIDNIECVFGDWHESLKGKKCDVSILSYCNGIIEYFDFLKNITNNYLIGIHLLKNKVHNFGVNKHTDIGKTFNRRETSETIMTFLDENKIPYELKKIECEFGQPFKEKSEAGDFIKEYFKITDKPKIDEIIETNLIKKDDYYYLPNTKKSGIIIIDIKKLKEGNCLI